VTWTGLAAPSQQVATDIPVAASLVALGVDNQVVVASSAKARCGAKEVRLVAEAATSWVNAIRDRSSTPGIQVQLRRRSQRHGHARYMPELQDDAGSWRTLNRSEPNQPVGRYVGSHHHALLTMALATMIVAI
jgi:hypothetical protein